MSEATASEAPCELEEESRIRGPTTMRWYFPVAVRAVAVTVTAGIGSPETRTGSVVAPSHSLSVMVRATR